MADIKKVSEQIVDFGERLGNVADAAKGKDGKSPRARWLLLPAAGAGLYALATSGAFTRQAKDVVKEVRTRAADLPDELVSRVQDATGTSNGPQSTRSRSQSTRSRSQSTRSRSGTRRRSKTASSSR
jgi:hypothetical protein